jgi:hypothetical protein
MVKRSETAFKDRGVQIDLLIDRRDHVINLCEIKFTLEPFSITKDYIEFLPNPEPSTGLPPTG